MFRASITFVFAMTVSVSNLVGNSYQSHAAEIRYQKGQVNTIIPDDVMNEFLSAPQTVKEKHCTNNSNYAYQEIARLAQSRGDINDARNQLKQALKVAEQTKSAEFRKRIKEQLKRLR